MNRIDYELGLMSSEEDFQNADGKALFLACTAGCIPKHPFNKGKREDCKAKCAAKFEVRQTDKKIFGANKTLRDRAAAAEEAAATVSAAEEAEKVSDNSDENVKDKGLSTGAMIGIGVGVLALVGIVVLIIKKR
tara:strand:- start:195 stop:596 length:402 start_codon:yes stop_codon:yes gene_type:complete